MKNQKFPAGDTPGPPSIARASGPRIRASPEKSPHLSNQQPQLQFASYGTVFMFDHYKVVIGECRRFEHNVINCVFNRGPFV